MHYICTGGCRGVAETPGTCGEETCQKHSQPLTECDCTDGKHDGASRGQPEPGSEVEDDAEKSSGE